MRPKCAVEGSNICHFLEIKLILCTSVLTWQKACCVTFGQIRLNKHFPIFVGICPLPKKICPSNNRKLTNSHIFSLHFRPQAETIFLAMLLLLNDSFLAKGAKIQTCIDNCIHFQANLTLKIDNQVLIDRILHTAA